MSRKPTKPLGRLWEIGSGRYEPASWQPPADIYRCRDGWLVKFDLAGVRPEDVQCSVRGSRLTIRGSRRDASVKVAQQAYAMEISYNQFERSIELPVKVEGMRVITEYSDGMFLVYLLQGESHGTEQG
jgi:HSP20 family protein